MTCSCRSSLTSSPAVFLVSCLLTPPSLSLLPSLTHSLTHSLTPSLFHSHTHTHRLSLRHHPWSERGRGGRKGLPFRGKCGEDGEGHSGPSLHRGRPLQGQPVRHLHHCRPGGGSPGVCVCVRACVCGVYIIWACVQRNVCLSLCG